MMKRILFTVFVLTVVPGVSPAQVTYEVIGVGMGTDMSADGTIVTGNTFGEYETFIWTREIGIVPLGRATYSVLGVGAGSPDISDDGTHITATILDDTGTLATPGIWTMDAGWSAIMPPLLPDGGVMDLSLGSAWGLSGDGRTVVGLYWRPGYSDGSAHAFAWDAVTGARSLGSTGGSSRANAANYDGSVVVGWTEARDGSWCPTVWENGELTVLAEVPGLAEAHAVTPDGRIIVGSTWIEPHQTWHTSVASAWYKDGDVWDEQILGSLLGTTSPFGLATMHDVTTDGSMMVGYNQFNGPFYATGIIWTEETGLIDMDEFLTDRGIILDPEFDHLNLTAISDDGTVMMGIGLELVDPFFYKTFLIHVCDGSSTGHDGDGDGDVDLYDAALFQQCFTGADAGAIPPGCAPFNTDCDLDVDLDDFDDFAAVLSGPVYE